ncbi:MAG: ParB/RepB/Spo0J family partition protein, partial [Nitrososphaerales archaeon]
IKVHGILEPIVCRQVKDELVLIAGYRRLTACKGASMSHVPVRVIDCDEKTAMELSFIENDNREENTPMEIARYFERYKKKFNTTDEQTGKSMGLSRPTINNYLRLLTLPNKVQEYVENGGISAHDALHLLKLDDQSIISKTAEQAVKEHWTTATLEAYIDSLVKSKAYIEAKAEADSTPNVATGVTRDVIVTARCAWCAGEYPRNLLGQYNAGVCQGCAVDAETAIRNKYKQKARVTGYETVQEAPEEKEVKQ